MSNLKPGQSVRLGARGDLAHHAKVSLNGGNVFHLDTLSGGDKGVNAVFGPGAASATIEMKRRLGYPKSAIGPAYGSVLDAYLHGTRKLPPAYQARRAALAAQTSLAGTRSHVLKVAASQVGYVESYGNVTKYGAAYGMNGVAWCAEFQTWVLQQCGLGWFHYAYVPAVVEAARSGDSRLRIARGPAPGRLVCYDWEHDGTADHIGLCTSGPAGGAFEAIEGNTSDADFSNGGMVLRRTRSISLVQAFIDVKGVTF